MWMQTDAYGDRHNVGQRDSELGGVLGGLGEAFELDGRYGVHSGDVAVIGADASAERYLVKQFEIPGAGEY